MSLNEIKHPESKDNPINKFYVHTLNVGELFLPMVNFVPNLLFGGNNVGMGYDTQAASFTKMGNIIFYTINLGLNNKGTSTGSATVTLPPQYPSSSLFNASVIPISTFVIAPGTMIMGVIFPNTTEIQIVFYDLPTGTLNGISDTNYANNSGTLLSGFYFIA